VSGWATDGLALHTGGVQAGEPSRPLFAESRGSSEKRKRAVKDPRDAPLELIARASSAHEEERRSLTHLLPSFRG
jgi:hypothetical protein